MDSSPVNSRFAATPIRAEWRAAYKLALQEIYGISKPHLDVLPIYDSFSAIFTAETQIILSVAIPRDDSRPPSPL